MKLFRFLCYAGICWSNLGPVFSSAATKPPNIVFIFSDDHAYQAISAYGDSRQLNQTPNIDRLAREGMIFHRALVPNSICGPSRACAEVVGGREKEQRRADVEEPASHD